MRIVKEGEKRQVICPNCGRTTATYALRDVDFSDKSGTVKGVLAGVCDQCDSVVSIPAQSTAKVKAEYKKVKRSLDVRLPVHYLDILTLASQKIEPDISESFNKSLVLYYLHALNTGRYSSDNMAKLLDTELAKAKASKRLSFKLNERNMKEIDSFMCSQGLKNNTDVFKTIILKINEDIVQPNKPKHLADLQNFAAAFA